ncbi:hypothetical protein GCM10009608_34080 [Pseudonocardia alaniniphila]
MPAQRHGKGQSACSPTHDRDPELAQIIASIFRTHRISRRRVENRGSIQLLLPQPILSAVGGVQARVAVLLSFHVPRVHFDSPGSNERYTYQRHW